MIDQTNHIRLDTQYNYVENDVSGEYTGSVLWITIALASTWT